MLEMSKHNEKLNIFKVIINYNERTNSGLKKKTIYKLLQNNRHFGRTIKLL